MKNLILGSLLLLLFAPTLTAQNIAVMYNGGESEMAQGGSMTVYYKTNESTICDIFFNLKPDGQAEGKSYKLTYTKVNQKGNTNWESLLSVMETSVSKLMSLMTHIAKQSRLPSMKRGLMGSPTRCMPHTRSKGLCKTQLKISG